MAKTKISSKDFLDLLDEHNDQPAPSLGSFGHRPLSPSVLANSETESTDAERVANGEQTGSKEVAKRVANGEQTGSKRVAAANIIHAPLLDQKPKRVAQRVAQRVANREQTGSKRVAPDTFEGLVGQERKLFFIIFKFCRLYGELVTPPITLERISESMQVTKNRAKNLTQRLIEKGLILRDEGRTGRAGWTKFRLEKDLFQKALLSETDSKEVAIGYQTGSKEGSKQVAQRVASVPSSSSFLDLRELKTTTTGAEESPDTAAAQLGPEWLAVDYGPLSEIGFTQNHLTQIARQSLLKPEAVQDSIFAFAFDLRVNGKGRELKSPPLNYFMGIVRRGNPYAAPDNYLPPHEEAVQKYLAAKRAAAERSAALRQQLADSEFTDWAHALGVDGRKKLAPEYKEGSPLQRAQLRNYFDQNVWPEREGALQVQLTPVQAVEPASGVGGGP